MKVISSCRTDWACFGYDNAMALRSVGVDAESLCMIEHSFGYTHASTPATKETIKRKMKEADVVQIMHSCSHSLNYYISSGSKAKLIVYHTGSIYRNNPEVFNKLFNPMVAKSVIALPEFSGLGCKNEQYLVGAIDTSRIGALPYQPHTPYQIAHYPSNPEVKGTKEIEAMMEKVGYRDRFSFVTSSQLVSMEQQYERAMDCDIYIELFKPTLNGKPYGSFGIQALESAAMGKIVVSQNMHKDVYSAEYGDCNLILPEREEDFIFAINLLVNLSPEKIMEMQKETREWVVKNHSYKSSGERILKKVLQ